MNKQPTPIISPEVVSEISQHPDTFHRIVGVTIVVFLFGRSIIRYLIENSLLPT